jgi:lipid II:glycine glycyltransferase (peptidoglycan interpeptide bridge formation enzyme)
MNSFHESTTNSISISEEIKYSAEFDKVGENEWYDLLRLFDDANLYQAWSYEDQFSRFLRIEHFILKEGNDVVAAAQICVILLPIFKCGIAYVRWGPMWRKKGQTQNADVLAHALRALRAEYVEHRKLLLRIFPMLFDINAGTFLTIFEAENFFRSRFEKSHRTLLIALKPSLEELRKGIRRTWRQKIGYAMKNNLEITEGTGTELIKDAIRIYDEMHQRKRFFGGVSMTRYLRVQDGLPSDLKLRTMICKHNSNFTAAMVWAAVGEIGLPVLAATANNGLKNFSSYLLWWKMLESLKNQGSSFLNVGGINPERNTGGYVFKKGFTGKNGMDVYFLGKFDAYMLDHPISALSLAIVKVIDLCKFMVAKLNYFVWKITHPKKIDAEGIQTNEGQS